jgi:predicted metal-dependent hydrolase
VKFPAKKPPSAINPRALTEPAMTDEDWRDYEEGWRLFNERQFWHAHEAWENVWKRRPEESRIFFQGIIQLAAAYHLLLVKKRYGGMLRNFEKAEEKLRLFPSRFLRVDVAMLLVAVQNARDEVARVGPDHLERFNASLIPVVAPPG